LSTGCILVEIKHQINDPEQNAAVKARAEHSSYGRVLMLYLDETKSEWMTVSYDEYLDKNMPDRYFRTSLLRTF